MMDADLIGESLKALVSQSILAGHIGARDNCPPDMTEVNSRIQETFNLIVAEHAADLEELGAKLVATLTGADDE